jgi:DNA-binding MarR family transcriptional regulator
MNIEIPKFRETLNHVFQRVNALQRSEKRCFGVSMSQCMTLELLHREGPLAIRDLSERLGLDASTVTRVVDVLVRDDLVQRNRSERGDRRRVATSLTAKGRRLAKRLEANADQYCERILKRLPADRHEDVIFALRTLVDALDDLPDYCQP